MDNEHDVLKLQQEILATNAQMIQGVLLVVALMVGSFVAAELSRKVVLFKLVFALAVTMTFWIARNDYLIHRAGAHIRDLELKAIRPFGWETSKASLKSTKLMGFIDLLAASGLIWMLWQCGAVLVEAGESGFVWLSATGVLLGIVATVSVIYLAQKRW